MWVIGNRSEKEKYIFTDEQNKNTWEKNTTRKCIINEMTPYGTELNNIIYASAKMIESGCIIRWKQRNIKSQKGEREIRFSS